MLFIHNMIRNIPTFYMTASKVQCSAHFICNPAHDDDICNKRIQVFARQNIKSQGGARKYSHVNDGSPGRFHGYWLNNDTLCKISKCIMDGFDKMTFCHLSHNNMKEPINFSCKCGVALDKLARPSGYSSVTLCLCNYSVNTMC